MHAVVTDPAPSSVVLSRLVVGADVIVTGVGVAVTLAGAAAHWLELTPKTEGLVFVQRETALALGRENDANITGINEENNDSLGL